MTTIAIDGQSEEDFRRAIESDLRHGRDSAAIARIQTLLAPYAGPNGILPERFLTVTAQDLTLPGWSFLGDSIARHDRPGRPVTAISIAFGWAGEEPPEPDAQGRLHPHIETSYYNDAAYPFSQSGRDDLLDGYSLHGCNWAADCEASDNALSLDGIDDLHGALALLEAQLLASEEPDADAIVAGSLGACLLSALLFQAVGQRIAADGLPRPVCVTAGSNGVYPYFDAPVAGMPESARRAAEKAEEEEETDTGIPGPRYSSLLMTGIPRAQKRAVLVLAETEGEMAVRIARLRGHGEGGESESQPPEPLPLPEPPPAVSPASPLLSKKTPQHSWDFRDMLGPPPKGSDSVPASQLGPEDDADLLGMPVDLTSTEPAPAEISEAAPVEPTAWREASRNQADDQPEPVVPILAPSAADAEPGFALLNDSLQGRLESLLLPQVPLTFAPPPPATVPEDHSAEPQPALPEPWPEQAAGLAWPFGTGWDKLDPDRPEVSETALELAVVTPQPVGLLARLRGWIRWAR